MKREDVIRLAREAGFEDWAVYGRIESKEDCLERFAALVAQAEREACARLAEEQWEIGGTQRRTAERCAAAIRTRGDE